MTNLNANLEITQAIDRLQTKYPEAWTNEVHRLEEIIPPSDPDYQILLKLRHKTHEVFDSEAMICQIARLMRENPQNKILARQMHVATSTMSRFVAAHEELKRLQQHYQRQYTKVVVEDAISGGVKIFPTPGAAAKAIGISFKRLRVMLTQRENPPMIYGHLQAKRMLWYQNDGGMQ